jgi:hypothetical protein
VKIKEELVENNAGFSLDLWFWEGLIKAGILSETINNIPIVNRIQEVCIYGNHINQYKLGIIDLLTTDIESISDNSVVIINSAFDLFKFNINLKHTKKIILIGENTLKIFQKDFPDLGTINPIPLESIHNLELFQKINGIKPDIKKSFNENNADGSLGTIEVDGFKIEVYYQQMPLKRVKIF